MILPLEKENLSKENPDPKIEQKRWKCDSCSQSFTQSGSLNNYSIRNGAELGDATGAMAPLFFWSRKVSKSKSRSLEWHQLFLPSFGANAYVPIYPIAG